MHLAVVVVAVTAVGIPVWNRFVLCNVQPRHFLSVQDLQVLKTLGTGSASTKQIQTTSQGRQRHTRSRMWQDSTNLGTGPVACFRVKNMYVVQSIRSVPPSKDKYFSCFFQDAARVICPPLGAFARRSYLSPGHGRDVKRMNVVKIFTAVSSTKDEYLLPVLHVIGRMHVARTGWGALDGRLVPPQSLATAGDFQNVHITGRQGALAQPPTEYDDAARDAFSSLFPALVAFAVVALVSSEGGRVSVATRRGISRHCVCVPAVFVSCIETGSTSDSWIQTLSAVAAKGIVAVVWMVVVKGWWLLLLLMLTMLGTWSVRYPILSRCIHWFRFASVGFVVSADSVAIPDVVNTAVVGAVAIRKRFYYGGIVHVAAATAARNELILQHVGTDPSVFPNTVQEQEIVVSSPVVTTETVQVIVEKRNRMILDGWSRRGTDISSRLGTGYSNDALAAPPRGRGGGRRGNLGPLHCLHGDTFDSIYCSGRINRLHKNFSQRKRPIAKCFEAGSLYSEDQ